MIKICSVCGIEFHTYESINKKFCSKDCWFVSSKKKTQLKNKRTCQICGKEFQIKHSKSPGLFCSYKCMGLHNRKTKIARMGYVYLNMPGHPSSSKQGYYAEHKYTVEQDIGRYLEKGEIVHHVNGEKDDNRIENLKLMSDSKHKKLHSRKRNRRAEGMFL